MTGGRSAGGRCAWRWRCFATNFPSRFYWTGGAFLRWDWLFYFVGGDCLVKKERPLLAGLFLGYSTLLRIFPVLTFSGPVLMAARAAPGGRTRPTARPGGSGCGAIQRFKTEERYHMLTIYKPQPAKSLGS